MLLLMEWDGEGCMHTGLANLERYVAETASKEA
jgi:hypothetical protein